MDALTYARSVFVRLIRDDDGQDLVEYALLTGLVAVGIAIAMPARTALRDIYNSWVDNVANLWEPPAPTGGS
jgi:Flp pilus assembly pilin Flp